MEANLLRGDYMQKLKLYIMKACPFCKKVMRFMEKNNVEGVEIVDIDSDPRHKEDLVKIGGVNQVPMLLIDDNPMYESEDIIQWMRVNKL